MRWSIIAIATACAVAACDAPTESLPITVPTSERYFTTAPSDAPVDEAAACVDSDQPNITENDYVVYWQTVFDDQRAAYPDQEFPPPAQLADDKRAEWQAGPNNTVSSGADAAFSREVCGLPLNDGKLYSGVELRTLRGQVAQYGRAACNSIADSGVRQVWDQLHPIDPATSPVQGGEAPQFELLVHSVLVHVCPQLSDYQGPPLLQNCADLTFDPSTNPAEGIFCSGDR